MATHEKNRGRVVLDELRASGYKDSARARATRRRSPWNLLLIPLAIGGIGASYYLFLHLVVAARNIILPQYSVSLQELFRNDCQGISAVIFVLCPFLAAMPVGFLLCNCVAWLIPAARRTFAKEAAGVWHASFAEAQRDLLVFAKFVVPVFLALSLAGGLVLRCPR